MSPDVTQHLKHLLFTLVATLMLSGLAACGGSAEPIDPAGSDSISVSFEEPAADIDSETYELQTSCRGASRRCCDRVTGACSTGINSKGQVTGEANCSDASCSTRPSGQVIAIDAACWCVAQ